LAIYDVYEKGRVAGLSHAEKHERATMSHNLAMLNCILINNNIQKYSKDTDNKAVKRVRIIQKPHTQQGPQKSKSTHNIRKSHTIKKKNEEEDNMLSLDLRPDDDGIEERYLHFLDLMKVRLAALKDTPLPQRDTPLPSRDTPLPKRDAPLPMRDTPLTKAQISPVPKSIESMNKAVQSSSSNVSSNVDEQIKLEKDPLRRRIEMTKTSTSRTTSSSDCRQERTSSSTSRDDADAIKQDVELAVRWERREIGGGRWRWERKETSTGSILSLAQPKGLPDGYEMKTTDQGQLYFLHVPTGNIANLFL
jgi:hypothetical protein